jgi:hypothetical protein
VEVVSLLQNSNTNNVAHFAEINQNGVVVRVVVVSDKQEHRGQEFLANDLGLGGTWLKTSYNTYAGKHLKGGIPYRKNYAGTDYVYDAQRDAFIPPRKFESWVLNEDTCQWVPPIPRPKDGKRYRWDEPTVSWVEYQSAE